MLTLNYIQENPGEVVEKLAKRNFDARRIVDTIIELRETKNQIQVQSDNAKAEMNRLSKEIGVLFREGKTGEANLAKERTGELKENIRQRSEERRVGK